MAPADRAIHLTRIRASFPGGGHMSARPSARPSARRRTTLAATAVAAAAVCGTLFAPAAHAAPGDSDLRITVSDRTSAHLLRGSGTETFTLTVANPTGAAAGWTGLTFGEATGPSPIAGSQIDFAMTPITAPATDVTVGQEDWSAMAMFQPEGTKAGTEFTVPAHGSLSWKVTFGFRANYPGNDDGIDFVFGQGQGAQHVLIAVAPALADGKLTGTWGPAATVAPGAPGRTWYELKDTAGGTFDVPLNTYVSTGGTIKGLGLQVLVGGRWGAAKDLGDGQFVLPQVPKGFAGGDTYRYDLRFTVPDGKGTAPAGGIGFTVMTGLAAYNTSPIVDMDVKGRLHYDPTPATATPTPTQTPTGSATPTASPTAPATTAPAPTATASGTPGTGQLAHTGSGNAGIFAALAALFAAAGVGMIAAVTRRRRNNAA